MKKILLGMMVLSIGLATSTFAQDDDQARLGGEVDRMKENFDALPEDVKGQVDTYRDERQDLRDTLKNDYLLPLGDDATADAKKEAIEQFKDDFAVEIEANRELAKETGEAVRDTRPERPDLPAEIRAMIEDFKTTQARIKNALREHLAGLPDDSTREQIHAAIREFNADHAEAIAANKELGETIREMVEDYKDDSSDFGPTVIVDRDDLSVGLAVLRERFQLKRRTILAKTKRERAKLRALAPEEREEALIALRQELKDDLIDLKEKRRRFIEDRLDEAVTDRRPDE